MNPDVIVREGGLRDGLQLVKTFLPKETKIAWARAAAAAGVPEVEVTSFVPAKVIAQFADAGEVGREAVTIPGPVWCALTPNRKGAENALAAGFRKINFVLSVSEGHNLANVRKSTDQSFEEFRQIADLLRSKPEYKGITLQGCLATSLGCTIEGRVPQKRVLAFAERYLSLGADEIALADTVGYASPGEVKRLFTDARKIVGNRPIYSHFHDTRGLGLANVFAAVEAGCRHIDASTAGLGGCPFAPGASGNIVLEDLVFMLENEGFKTGIDLEKLKDVRKIAETALPNENVYGTILRVGVPKGFVPAAERREAAE